MSTRRIDFEAGYPLPSRRGTDGEVQPVWPEDGVSVSVVQDTEKYGLAGCVWDAALVLGHYLKIQCIRALQSNSSLKVREPLSGRRVLELGAGTGVLSAFLAVLGATALVTDLPEALPLIRENIKLNSKLTGTRLDAHAVGYSWGTSTDTLFPSRAQEQQSKAPSQKSSDLERKACVLCTEVLEKEKFDCVICADLLYEVKRVPILVQSLQEIAGRCWRTAPMSSSAMGCLLDTSAGDGEPVQLPCPVLFGFEKRMLGQNVRAWQAFLSHFRPASSWKAAVHGWRTKLRQGTVVDERKAQHENDDKTVGWVLLVGPKQLDETFQAPEIMVCWLVFDPCTCNITSK